MEKDDVYPAGWKHRKFFAPRNDKDKKPRTKKQDSIEQQVLREQQTELVNLVRKQEEERQAILATVEHQQREEECRLKHEAERLQLLEDRMAGPGGVRPKESTTA